MAETNALLEEESDLQVRHRTHDNNQMMFPNDVTIEQEKRGIWQLPLRCSVSRLLAICPCVTFGLSIEQ